MGTALSPQDFFYYYSQAVSIIICPYEDISLFTREDTELQVDLSLLIHEGIEPLQTPPVFKETCYSNHCHACTQAAKFLRIWHNFHAVLYVATYVSFNPQMVCEFRIIITVLHNKGCPFPSG